MQRFLNGAALIAVCLGLGAAASASPFNLVADGGFEEPAISGDFTTYYATTQMGDWTITNGSVDLIHSYWTPSEGAQSLDLSGYTPGTIASQTITTVPGGSYLLMFDMAGNPDRSYNKTMDVLWNGGTVLSPTFVQDGHSRTSMGWTTYSVLVHATGATSTVGFKSTTPAAANDLAAFGPALDNVRLYAVPESPSLLLLAPGLLPVAFLLRRRRA